MKKKRQNVNKKSFSKEKSRKKKEKEKEGPMCYEYKKLEHFKVDCPLKKSIKKIKRKAMMATWNDYDDSSFDAENQEVVNLCLMAQEEEVYLIANEIKRR